MSFDMCIVFHVFCPFWFKTESFSGTRWKKTETLFYMLSLAPWCIIKANLDPHSSSIPPVCNCSAETVFFVLHHLVDCVWYHGTDPLMDFLQRWRHIQVTCWHHHDNGDLGSGTWTDVSGLLGDITKQDVTSRCNWHHHDNGDLDSAVQMLSTDSIAFTL